MRSFFHLIVISIFSIAPYSAYAGARCEDCRIFRHGVHRRIVPSPDTRCVPFVQQYFGTVYLRLNLKNGGTRPYTKKNAAKEDCIVVGRHWLRNKTDSAYICNRENHADYPLEDVHELASQPKMSRENEACLFGKDRCEEMRYKTPD